MKTFKNLREALAKDKPTSDKAGKKLDATSPNSEAASLQPRSDGERKFKDMHAIKKVPHPENQDVAFSGTAPPPDKAEHQPDNGERVKVMQGSSGVGMKSQNQSGGTKQTPVGRENPKGPYGDIKPVVTSPSAVKSVTPSGPREAFKTFRESLESVDESTPNNSNA